MRHVMRDVLYMHVQASEQFVISNGMSFKEFANSLEKPLNHLLLLKHRYDETEFNLNVCLDYVIKDNVYKLVREDVQSYGDFCWIDFKEESSLDDIEAVELAELLYLGHMKQHLKHPFFSKLRNQYVYLAQDDEWFSKVYYRSVTTFYKMLGNLLLLKLEGTKMDRNWWGLKKPRKISPVPIDILVNLSSLLSEGIVFSLKKATQTRLKIEIPIWVVGDFRNMDDMLDSYDECRQQKPDAFVTYLWKTGVWSLHQE